jgi:1-acyl-sn-glycerol-3-phosphate acyltransferase
MNPAIVFFRKIWKGLFFTNALLTMVLLYPAFYILLSKNKWFPLAMRLKRFWAHLLLFDVGIFYSVEQVVPLDPKQSYVFCPNHSSYLDIILSYIAIPNYFHFIGKAELKHVPLFKIFFKDMDITVDRKSIRDSHRAMLRAASDLKQGISIAIFPEGTIPVHVPRMGKFKNGPFKLAIENQVPVVPVVYLSNYKILPDDRKGARVGGRPGISRVKILAPIPTLDMTEADIEILRDKVYQQINESLMEVNSKQMEEPITNEKKS